MSRTSISHRLTAEALATGLAYSAGLCWASVSLVASFRPRDLSLPYWSGVPGLRTDTCGIMAFFVVAACFGTGEYLRLRRRQCAFALPPPASGPLVLLGVAFSETVAVLATGLAAYISVNAVTHPATLQIRATHLATWPTEGTLRVVALLLCACSVAAFRFLRASVPQPSRAAPSRSDAERPTGGDVSRPEMTRPGAHQ